MSSLYNVILLEDSLDRCGMEYVERLDFLQLDSLEVRRIKANLILYHSLIVLQGNKQPHSDRYC